MRGRSRRRPSLLKWKLVAAPRPPPPVPASVPLALPRVPRRRQQRRRARGEGPASIRLIHQKGGTWLAHVLKHILGNFCQALPGGGRALRVVSQLRDALLRHPGVLRPPRSLRRRLFPRRRRGYACPERGASTNWFGWSFDQVGFLIHTHAHTHTHARTHTYTHTRMKHARHVVG